MRQGKLSSHRGRSLRKLGMSRLLLALFGLFLMCRWGLPFVISPIADQYHLKKQVIELAQKQYNIKLDIENLWVEPTFRHGLMLRLETVKLNAPNLGLKLDTNQIRLYLAYLPLVQQKLQPARLEIESGLLHQWNVNRPTSNQTTTSTQSTTASDVKTPNKETELRNNKKPQNRLAVELIDFKIQSQFLKEKYDLNTLGVGQFLLEGITLRKSTLPNIVCAKIRDLSLLTIRGHQPWQKFKLDWNWQGHLPNMTFQNFLLSTEWLEISGKTFKPEILIYQWIKQKLPALPLQHWHGTINNIDFRILKTADSWLSAVSVDSDEPQIVKWQQQFYTIPKLHLKTQADWSVFIMKPMGLELRSLDFHTLLNHGEIILTGHGYVAPHDYTHYYAADIKAMSRNIPIDSFIKLIPFAPDFRNITTGLSGQLSSKTQILASAGKPLSIVSTGTISKIKLADRYDGNNIIKNGEINYNFDNQTGFSISHWSLPINNSTIEGIASFVPLVQPQLFIATSASKLDLSVLQQLIESRWPTARRYFQPLLSGSISGSGYYLKLPFSTIYTGKVMPVDSVVIKPDYDTMNDLSLGKSIQWQAGNLLADSNQRYRADSVQLKLANNNQLTLSGFWDRFSNQWQVISHGAFTDFPNLLLLPFSYTNISDLLPDMTVIFEQFKPVSSIKITGEAHFEYAGTTGKPLQYLETDNTHFTLKGLGHLFNTKQFKLLRTNTDLLVSTQGLMDNTPWYVIAQTKEQQLKGSYRIKQLPLLLLYDIMQYVFPTQTMKLSSLAGTITTQGQIAGTVKSPEINGNVDAQNVAACEKSTYDSCLKNMSGHLALNKWQLDIQTLAGNVNDQPFTVNGLYDFIHANNRHINIDAKNWSVKTLQAKLPQVFKQLQGQLPFDTHSGLLTAHIQLSGPQLSTMGGQVTINNFAAFVANLKSTLLINSLNYDLTSGQISAPQIYLDKQLIQLSGLVKNAHQYNVGIVSNNISMDYIIHLLRRLRPDLPLNNIIRQSGAAGLNAHIQPTGLNAKLDFHDAAFSSLALPFSVSHINGDFAMTQHGKAYQVNTSGLKMRYANSPIIASINGTLDKNLKATATILGDISPLLFNTLSPRLNANEPSLIHIPFDFTYKTPEQTALLKSNFSSLKPENAQTSIKIPLPFDSSKPSFVVDAQIKPEQFTFRSIRLQTAVNDSLIIQGYIENPMYSLFKSFHFDIQTPKPFHMETLFGTMPAKILADLSGTLDTNLTIEGHPNLDMANGKIAITNVQSLPLNIKGITAEIEAKNTEVFWRAQEVKLPGVDVSFTAHTDDLTTRPLPLSDFNLEGKQFVISQFADWFATIFQPKLINHPLVKKWFPSKPHDALGYEIPNGQINIKEVILNDVIVENVKSPIQLLANGIIELSDLTAESTGGTLKGNITYNPRQNSYMRVHVEYADVQANALARVLFTLNNQIFGRIAGVLDFTTEGLTQAQQLANVNGQIHFNIKDGRLPAVHKIENLMVTANTVAGGFLNLNLNSLFHFIIPFENEAFSELSGDFNAVNGILITNNLASRGQNFNLDISGAIRMMDGDSNLQIKGTVPRQIRGLFGGVGSLSFGRILSILPPVQKIISWVPFVGWVPGLSKPHQDRGVGFSIQMQGPVYDQASLKNFKWLR